MCLPILLSLYVERQEIRSSGSRSSNQTTGYTRVTLQGERLQLGERLDSSFLFKESLLYALIRNHAATTFAAGKIQLFQVIQYQSV